MKQELKKLTKEQLIDLSESLLDTQNMYYESSKEKETAHSCFYMLAGAFNAIRERFGLPFEKQD